MRAKKIRNCRHHIKTVSNIGFVKKRFAHFIKYIYTCQGDGYMKLSVKMDKQGRIIIPKEIRKLLRAEQTFKVDYIEEYIKSHPYNKATCTDAIILEICNERNNYNEK